MSKGRDPLAWVMDTWTWRRGQGKEVITRDGVLVLGEDGKKVVAEVARRAWEDWLWAAETRTQREENPMRDIAFARPDIRGHKEWAKAAKGEPGVSSNRVTWMYATHGPQIPGSRCTCLEKEPRRHHWAWECARAGCEGVEPPRHESEKRLCVPMVERPQNAEARDYNRIQGIKEAVKAEIRRHGWALVATDGGSIGKNLEERRASYGIAVGQSTWEGSVGGLDQTSYKSELWALYKLLRSIAGTRGRIVVIIDNQAVAREATLRKKGQGSKNINCEGLWQRIQEELTTCPEIAFHWVP